MLTLASVFGEIKNPFGFFKATEYTGVVGPKFGLIVFLNNLLRIVFVFAGLFAFLNIVFSGFGFISAAGDPKKVSNAWAKIWQSLVGLIIIAASFIFAAIFGQLVFGDATAILNPKIYSVK